MKYAVVSLSGTQYQIEENQTITINKLDTEKTNNVIESVLLSVDGDTVKVGNPTIKGASVSFEIVAQRQGKKLEVSTFKAKSRYRRHIGFRSQLTDIKITKINL